MHSKFEVSRHEATVRVKVFFHQSLCDEHRSVVAPQIVVEGYLIRTSSSFSQSIFIGTRARYYINVRRRFANVVNK